MTQTDTLTRPLVIILAAIVLLPALAMVIMMPMVGMGMWGWGHMTDTGMWGAGWGAWMWLVMWLGGLLVVGGLGYLLYAGLRQNDGGTSDAALEELRMAYARGDLSDEEFEQRRERLDRSE